MILLYEKLQFKTSQYENVNVDDFFIRRFLYEYDIVDGLPTKELNFDDFSVTQNRH